MEDYDTSAGNVDTIVLSDDVVPGDVIIRRVDYNLVLAIDGTDDTLTVNNWFCDESGTWQVEQIEFGDGTIWDVESIRAMALQGTAEDDVLIGYSTDDTITGLAGEDTILGNAGDDTIDAGPGRDYVEGGTGNDRYIFGRGSGEDTVVDYDTTTGNVDTIALDEDILTSDITLDVDGNDLIIAINGTEDTMRVTGWFTDDESEVERIEFADGTVWDSQYILDNAGKDTLLMGTPDSDTLTGGSRDNVLMGLAGDDTLSGGEGNDTYVLSEGAGFDRIVENDSTTGNLDVVEFTDVGSADLDSVERWGNDLVLYYGEDRLTVVDYFDGTAARIEEIRFSDGMVLDQAALNWAVEVSYSEGTSGKDWLDADADVLNRIYGLAGKDKINGDSLADIIDGGSGNDFLYARAGADTIYGGSGNDTIQGEDGADTIYGGTGDDTLQGGDDGDTYVFSVGSGQDTIAESHATPNGTDVIRFLDVASTNSLPLNATIASTWS